VHIALTTVITLPTFVTATAKLALDAGLTIRTTVCASVISLVFATKVKAEAVAVALGFGVALVVALAVGDAVAAALIATPLSQTRSLPFLMAVYFLLRNIIT
jgi:hypothetical protein